MFARVSIIQGLPEQVDERAFNYHQQLIPEARKMTGFMGAYLLVDRKSGKNMGITLWETEKNLLETGASSIRLRVQEARITGTNKPPIVEIYEVAVHA